MAPDPALRRALAPGLRAARSLLLLPLLLAAACQTRHPSPSLAMADPEVLQTLRAQGEANVVILLVAPETDAALPEEVRRAEIQRRQDEVLQAIDPKGYRNRVRLTSVPALAGTVLSEEGLAALRRHPHVQRIDLDMDGGGTR
jgi:hypothetical protein